MSRPASSLRRAVAGAIAPALAVLIASLPACGPSSPAGVLPPQQIGTVPGPVALFERSCAACHGAFGEFFDPLRREWTDQERREMVQTMLRTRTAETATDAQIDALTAYVRSVREQRVFLAVTDAGEDRLAGEVTPGAVVAVQVGGQTLAAAVTDYRWSVGVPKGALIESITARKEAGGSGGATWTPGGPPFVLSAP